MKIRIFNFKKYFFLNTILGSRGTEGRGAGEFINKVAKIKILYKLLQENVKKYVIVSDYLIFAWKKGSFYKFISDSNPKCLFLFRIRIWFRPKVFDPYGSGSSSGSASSTLKMSNSDDDEGELLHVDHFQ
jgi:hypothetical protein